MLFKQMDQHAAQVDRMTDTLGVDLVEAVQRGIVPPETLRSTVMRCMSCGSFGACEGWLQDHADGAGEAPEYCRNKVMLDRLATSA